MSATLPPAPDLDTQTDFGELWRQGQVAPGLASVMPEAEVPVQSLSPEQYARRQRLRRAVGGVMLGLLAFTALATCVYVAKGRSAESGAALAAKLEASSPSASQPMRAATSVPVAAPVTTPAASESDQALALAHDPVATVANLDAWSRLAGQLSPADRHYAEHELSQLSAKSARPVQEAARLELALLWRATARRAKAQRVLVSLARTATDPLVKKYALGTLRST